MKNFSLKKKNKNCQDPIYFLKRRYGSVLVLPRTAEWTEHNGCLQKILGWFAWARAHIPAASAVGWVHADTMNAPARLGLSARTLVPRTEVNGW